MPSATPTVTISLDAAELELLLTELSDIAHQLVGTGLNVPDLPAEIARIDSNGGSASLTGEAVVRLKPSDSLLEFATALRALNRERLAG